MSGSNATTDIYCLVGAPRTGKSAAREHLRERFGIPGASGAEVESLVLRLFRARESFPRADVDAWALLGSLGDAALARRLAWAHVLAPLEGRELALSGANFGSAEERAAFEDAAQRRFGADVRFHYVLYPSRSVPDPAALGGFVESQRTLRGVDGPRVRVLLVLHAWVSEWAGGTEIYARGFAKTLAAAGAEVTVLHPIATGGAEPSVEEARDGALRLLRVRLAPSGALTRACGDPALEKFFAELLERERFDVVHFQHTWHALPFTLVPLARASGARVCMTLHDAWALCAQTHLFPPAADRVCRGPDTHAKCAACLAGGRVLAPDVAARLEGVIARRAELGRHALAAAHVVTTPSRWLRDKYAEYGLGGAIELEPLGLAPLSVAERAPAQPLAFGFLGTLSSLKNPLLLARAFARVRGDASLVFHGDGSADLRDALRAAARRDPRVRVAGAYAPAELGAVLGALDVVVLPSRSENSPLVLREALAAGRPVVATRVGGIPEIVDDGVSGLLFPVDDEEALTRCLQRLVDEPDLLSTLRAGIRPPRSMADDARAWLARYSASSTSLRDAA